MSTNNNTPPSNENSMKQGNKKKRLAENSLLLSDEEIADNSFAVFLVVETIDQQPLSLSIFAIQKILKCAVGDVKSAKKLRNGAVLLEVTSKTQSERALSMNQWVNPNDINKPIHIKVTPHRSLNSSKGVIRCRDLRDCSNEEILDALSSEGVTHVKHIMSKRETSVLPTNTFILTFGKPTPPKYIRVAYLNIPVEPFVPNPLRCFNCQKFGHGQSNCSHNPVCARCGLQGHKDNDCPAPQPKCANCYGDHPAYSRQCPEWTKQQTIVKIKTERNVSFNEAKQIYLQQSSSVSTGQPGASYASVVKTTKSVSTQTDLTWPNGNVAAKAIEISSSTVNTQHSIETQTSTKDDSHLGAVGGSSSTKPAITNRISTSNIPHHYSSTPRQKIQLNNTKPGPAFTKQDPRMKQAKGSNDPISLFNRYGSLDAMDQEVELSPGKGPGGRNNR